MGFEDDLKRLVELSESIGYAKVHPGRPGSPMRERLEKDTTERDELLARIIDRIGDAIGAAKMGEDW